MAKQYAESKQLMMQSLRMRMMMSMTRMYKAITIRSVGHARLGTVGDRYNHVQNLRKLCCVIACGVVGKVQGGPIFNQHIL
jgi:hypothetical protein